MAKTYAFSDRETAVKLRSIAESSRNRPTQKTAWTQPQTTYPLWACGPLAHLNISGELPPSGELIGDATPYTFAWSTTPEQYAKPFWWASGEDIWHQTPAEGYYPATLISGSFILNFTADSLHRSNVNLYLEYDGGSTKIASHWVDMSNTHPLNGATYTFSVNHYMLQALPPRAGGSPTRNATVWIEVVSEDGSPKNYTVKGTYQLTFQTLSTCLAPAWMIPRPLTDSNGNQLFDNDGNPLFGQFSPGGGGTQAPAGLNEPPE